MGEAQDKKWQSKLDPLIPPERFANLLRDAGINSIEAYRKALNMDEDGHFASESQELPKKTEDSPEKKA